MKTAIVEENNNLVNIDASVEFNDVQKETQRVTVEQLTKCKITLAEFGVVQMALGAEHFIKKLEKSTVAKITLEAFMMLTNSFLPKAENVGNTGFTAVIEREHLKQFKMFLEARMQHCEGVRNAEIAYVTDEFGKPKPEETFNKDTYIGQKLLLLDIREALLGREVYE